MEYYHAISTVYNPPPPPPIFFFFFADNEQLARSGTNCLENLAVSVGKQFFPDTWNRICQCIRDIYLASIPHQLLSWKPDGNFISR